MSLSGLEKFRGADNGTAFRLLRDSQRSLLVIAALRGLFFGALLALAITYLARTHQ